MTFHAGAPSPSSASHREAAPRSIRCAVLTISDTRTPETDASGRLIRDLLAGEGHQAVAAEIVPDDPGRIRSTLSGWIADPAIQAVLTNGGTGIAARDTTYDAIAAMLDKRIDGFGELFRMLSYQEIGAAAMLSRAVAGVAGGTVIVAMPGSSNAVRLAMTALVLPELGHLVYEVGK
ncbi:MAG: molybdenum cofactor biosynthesis protein B [Chloroflexota bacterium]